MKVITAQPHNLPEIARVHMMCFPDSFSSQIGEKLLTKFYLEYIKINPDLFLIATDEIRHNKIVGFCMGYVLDNHQFNKKFLIHNFGALSIRSIYLCATGNKLMLQKIKNAFAKNEEYEVLDPNIKNMSDKCKGDLLSICVLDSVKGKGIAQQLISEFERRLNAQGKTICILSAKATNDRGNRFYEKCGYHIYKKSCDSICYAKELL